MDSKLSEFSQLVREGEKFRAQAEQRAAQDPTASGAHGATKTTTQHPQSRLQEVLVPRAETEVIQVAADAALTPEDAGRGACFAPFHWKVRCSILPQPFLRSAGGAFAGTLPQVYRLGYMPCLGNFQDS